MVDKGPSLWACCLVGYLQLRFIEKVRKLREDGREAVLQSLMPGPSPGAGAIPWTLDTGACISLISRIVILQ